MRITRQEVQIFGLVAIFLAAIYYAFGELPPLAQIGDAVRHSGSHGEASFGQRLGRAPRRKSYRQTERPGAQSTENANRC